MSKKAFRSAKKDDGSDSEDDITAKDVEKIQTLWNDVRQNKRDVDNAVTRKADPYAAPDVRAGNEENRVLREKLILSERQLNEARDNVVILSKKLRDYEDELERCHTKIAKQVNANSVQTTHLNELSNKYENLNFAQKEVIERSRESNHVLLFQLEEKDKEIEKLRAIIREKSDKLSKVSVSYDNTADRVFVKDHELKDKISEIQSLKHKLEDAERTIAELRLTKESEGLAFIEIEHLRSDVRRLVSMLRTTEEYKDFADFGDDANGNVRFLSTNMKQTKVDSKLGRGAMTPNGHSRHCAYAEQCLIDEKELWIPRDAFKFIQEWRKDYKGELTDNLIEKLLFELNRIWSRREQQRVDRLKEQYTYEMMKIKRRNVHSATYNEVQSKQTINRLKHELKSAYTENRTAFAERTPKNPPGTHYIGETIRFAKNLSTAKKEFKKENDLLRDHITKEKAQKPDPGREITAVTELHKLKTRVQDVLGQFENKRKEIMSVYDGKPDISLVDRKVDWLIENIETVMKDFGDMLQNKKRGKFQ